MPPPPVRPTPARLGAAHLACALLLIAAAWLAPPGALAAELPPDDADTGYAHLVQALRRANDDPRAALAAEQGVMAGTAPPAMKFWSLLAQARMHGLLEQPQQAMQALERAEAALATLSHDLPVARAAWQLHRLHASTLSADPNTLLPRLEPLTREIDALGHPRLACDLESLRVWIEVESGVLDAAWRSIDRALKCTADLGDIDGHAGLQVQLGMTASLAGSPAATAQGALGHFRRALEVLGERPARFVRSIVEWEIGKALSNDPPAALHHLKRAYDFSAAIGDEVGVGVAAIELAQVHLRSGQPGQALQYARDARRRYSAQGADHRLIGTFTVSLAALRALGHKGLESEIEAGRAWDLPAVSPRARARFAREAAQSYAALGQHARAYAELVRANRIEEEGRTNESNQAVLRLQAAFEAAQRDADNARLRLQQESSRLELEAASARQQGLRATLVGLLVALGAMAMLALRTMRQRRRLADLALRDELTGAPNRRAVQAIAETQWSHCRKLGMPLGVAMVDLDHFKRVNDTWGHDGGDRVLRAFAQAAQGTLRAQDRFGRMGGEEWLLVAPGAGPEDLRTIFRRISERFATTPIEGLPVPHGLTFSMGAACMDSSSATGSLAELLQQADARLYQAKQGGRNRVVVSG